MRRYGLRYLRFLFFARGNNTKNGFAGGPLFRIIFLRRSLAFDFSFLSLSLFGDVIAPLIPFSGRTVTQSTASRQKGQWVVSDNFLGSDKANFKKIGDHFKQYVVRDDGRVIKAPSVRFRPLADTVSALRSRDWPAA